MLGEEGELFRRNEAYFYFLWITLVATWLPGPGEREMNAWTDANYEEKFLSETEGDSAESEFAGISQDRFLSEAKTPKQKGESETGFHKEDADEWLKTRRMHAKTTTLVSAKFQV